MPWILPDGNYYDAGDSVAEGSVQVPARPSPLHSWVNGSWVIDPVKKAADKEIRITERAKSVGYATKGHLIDAIENARFRASVKLGITEAQAHTLGLNGNVMYQQAWAAWEDIQDIEVEEE